MKPLRIKIQEEATLKKVPMHVIEKDYVLSYVLAGMAKQPELSHSLIFKGGTALKKIFFGDYRFSEDLDWHKFVVILQVPNLEGLLFRLLPGNEHSYPSVASASSQLRRAWVNFQ